MNPCPVSVSDERSRRVSMTYLNVSHRNQQPLIDVDDELCLMIMKSLTCSCSQHAEKYDKEASSTEEIPDSPMTSPDSDYCISVNEAKTYNRPLILKSLDLK
jgi:hypothetical protein